MSATSQCKASRAIFVDSNSCELPRQIDLLAPSDASILIVGETGTGKEVVARKIHERSGRSGPFVAVNCGALSESLGEAALFGHEAGAYTGASGARAGWFEAANGGTLFLDEVGDLPLTLQVALLRVLQERQVVRLGSRKPTPIDIRVVAATNIDVSKAVANGQFRLDLYFRLSVATMELPPLRARTGDILPLAEHFIAAYGKRLQSSLPQLHPDAQAALLEHSWPGNIRELENVMHAAVLVCSDSVIRPGDLRLIDWSRSPTAGAASDATQAPQNYNQSQPQRSTPWANHQAYDAIAATPRSLQALAPQLDRLFEAPPEQLLERLQALVIRQAMERCRGNQVHTARLLGVSRNVLRTYLKRFGLLSDVIDRSGLREVESAAEHEISVPSHHPLKQFSRTLFASEVA
jgi:sigma-54-specific transcriptional regulator